MSQVNNTNYSDLVNTFNNLTDAEIAEIQALAKQFNTAVEDIATKYKNGEYSTSGSALTDTPELATSMSALSLDTLLSALDFEEQRNQVKSAVNSLNAKNTEIKEQGQKKIEQIQKQIEANKAAEKWGIFGKIFKVIGMIVGAIASALTVAAGVMTGNPLLVAAGVVGAVMAVDSIVSTATDGKVSLAAGFTALGKAMGMSEKAASIFGTVMNVVIIAASAIMSFGAAAAASGAKAATDVATTAVKATAETVKQVLSKATSIVNIINGTAGVGSGIVGIGTAVTSFQAKKAEANKIQIDAILERLRAYSKEITEYVEQMMEACENNVSKTKDIVDGTAETNTTILKGGSASMA